MIQICVEGSIGSGKSTVLQLLEVAYPKIPVYQERVSEWTYLAGFYEDPARYAYRLQKQILESLVTTRVAPVFFAERSTESGYWVFTQMIHATGLLTPEEYTLLTNKWKQLTKVPTHTIYLHTPPKVCFQRILARQRPAEIQDSTQQSRVTLEYLTMLDQYHEQYIRACLAQGIPVLRLNGEQPPSVLASEIQAWLQEFDVF